jgi:ABC-2 type transport system ATP-binding protein
MNDAVEFNKVTKQYDSFSIHPLSFSVPRGCITGLVGKNGAGKSTIIKMLAGIIHPDSGTIKVLENDVKSSNKEEIGIVLDSGGLSEYLNAIQVNTVMKSIYKTWDSERFFHYLDLFQIQKKKKIKKWFLANIF